METTKNKIPNDIQKMIDKFKKYIDTKIYYYGSIQRADYFVGKSDIDILIFTDNVDSMIHKTSHYFHIKKKKFRKMVWYYRKKLIEGTKIIYYSNQPEFRLEISIYDEKYKKYVLEDKTSPNNISFLLSAILLILKCMYYNLGILPNSFYTYYKKIIFNYIRGEDTLFVQLK